MENIIEQFNRVSQEYDRNREIFIPCFREFYDDCARFVSKIYSSSKILDLGAGTGLLDMFFYRYQPDAMYHLTDIADKMLDVAKERFKGLSNFSYEAGNYCTDYNFSGFDTVISALSIHHLEHDDKQRLFENIYRALPKNGIFVNFDQFCADDPLISQTYDTVWISHLENSSLSSDDLAKWQDRKKLDRECSVQTQIKMLKKAGFTCCECIFSAMKFSVVMARKL
ncbi:MAG: class I SAM-dependent methyltransferase [Succinivibrio sp.]